MTQTEKGLFDDIQVPNKEEKKENARANTKVTDMNKLLDGEVENSEEEFLPRLFMD